MPNTPPLIHIEQTGDSRRPQFELWRKRSPGPGIDPRIDEKIGWFTSRENAEARALLLSEHWREAAQGCDAAIARTAARQRPPEVAIEARAGDEAPSLDRTLRRWHQPHDGAAAVAELTRLIVRLTGSGSRSFKLGITARPGQRRPKYSGSGYSKMYVLCEHGSHRVIRALEKRLIAWSHAAGFPIDNAHYSPAGRRALDYVRYCLYLVC